MKKRLGFLLLILLALTLIVTVRAGTDGEPEEECLDEDDDCYSKHDDDDDDDDYDDYDYNHDDDKPDHDTSPSPPCPSESSEPSPSPSCPPKKESPSPVKETKQPSPSGTASITPSSSALPSVSTSPSPTSSASSSPTTSPSSSPSLIPSLSPSSSVSPSPSASVSSTASPSPSASLTPTPSPSSSTIPSMSPSSSSTASPSPSSSASPTASPSPSASISPTPSPSVTPSPTSSPSLTPSSTPSPSRTPSPTSSPSRTPSVSPSRSPSPILSTVAPSLVGGQAPSPSSEPPAPFDGCAPQGISSLAGFSVVALGNASSATSTFATIVDLEKGAFEGKVAANGGLRLRQFGVLQNHPCFGNDSQENTMIVKGQVDYSSGQLICGNLLTSDADNVINLPAFQEGSGLVVNENLEEVFDFQATAQELARVHSDLCSLDSTGLVDSSPSGEVMLQGTGQDVEVFLLDGSDLRETGYMRLVNVSTSTKEIVIQVFGEGTAVFSDFFFDAGPVPIERIVWPLCEAQRVVIDHILLPGVVLAPQADVTLQNGRVIGSIVSSSLRGGSCEIAAPPCS